jgi:acetyl esterase/lipase
VAEYILEPSAAAFAVAIAHVVDEYDVLRDEGEAYARKLIAAGVRSTSVRYNATMHDFMMLNALCETAAATEAITQAIDVLRQALKSSPPGTSS